MFPLFFSSCQVTSRYRVYYNGTRSICKRILKNVRVDLLDFALAVGKETMQCIAGDTAP